MTTDPLLANGVCVWKNPKFLAITKVQVIYITVSKQPFRSEALQVKPVAWALVVVDL